MSNEPWVIVVGPSPSELESREMLELVLAGATLEIDLVVVFDEGGCSHLEPDRFGPWRQLVDFDLAELHARDSGRGLLPGGVSLIGDDEFDRLCRSARAVLEL